MNGNVTGQETGSQLERNSEIKCFSNNWTTENQDCHMNVLVHVPKKVFNDTKFMYNFLGSP